MNTPRLIVNLYWLFICSCVLGLLIVIAYVLCQVLKHYFS